MAGNDEGSIEIIVNDLLKENATVSIKASTNVINGNTVAISYSLDRKMPNSNLNAALVETSVFTHIKA